MYKRSFNDKSIKGFNQELENVHVSPMTNKNKTNVSCKIFIKKYLKIFDQAFPAIQFKQAQTKNKCYNEELKNILQEKQKLFKKYCMIKSTSAKTNYNTARNKYFHALKKQKQEFYAILFKQQQNNMKQTWNTINTLLGKVRTKTCSSFKINNKITNDSQTISNHFNDYFTNVASELVKKLPITSHNHKKYLPLATSNLLYINPASPQELKNIISGLKPKTSCGIDEIPAKVLKSTSENILYALSHVFNLSLINDEYINNFKVEKVISIFKKGCAHELENYRPISLLPVMSKILEKLIYRRLVIFLNQQIFFTNTNLASAKITQQTMPLHYLLKILLELLKKSKL